MVLLYGDGCASGVSDAPLRKYAEPPSKPRAVEVKDTAAECKRMDAALESAKAVWAQRAQQETDKKYSQFALMCEVFDDLVAENLHAFIEEHKTCAEFAAFSVCHALAAELHAVDDGYIFARGTAFAAGASGLLHVLAGHEEDLRPFDTRVVLAVDTLYPSLFDLVDMAMLAGVVVRAGTYYSHTAILARSMGVPVVTNLGDGFDKLRDGVRTMVDGAGGIVTQEPSTALMSEIAQKMLQNVKEERQLQMLRGTPNITTNGVRVVLSVNIFRHEEARAAQQLGADGVGMFRSECLYPADESAFPDETALYRAYREALLMTSGKRVAVRLFDYAVYQSLYGKIERAQNPLQDDFSIAYLLENPVLLRTQLRALLRASAYGSLAILLPNVTCAQEIAAVKNEIASVWTELKSERKFVAGSIPVGALIETPVAAVTADLLAAQCDFLAVGTNDLAQYLLLTDRAKADAQHPLQMHHPALLRTIAQIVHAAHDCNTPVTICGEAASDVALTPFFAALQVDELSVAPPMLLRVKRALRAVTAADCKQALVAALRGTMKEK